MTLLTSLSVQIEAAIQLTEKLILVFKHEAKLWCIPELNQITQLELDKTQLIAERDQLLKVLNNLSVSRQPDEAELHYLHILQKLDTELILAKLECLIAKDPQETQHRYHRAVVLTNLGRNAEAQAEFMSVLSQDPTHYGTLIDFGNLLLSNSYRTAARSLYQQAVSLHNQETMGHVNLANLLLSEAEYETAKLHYEYALRIAPQLAEAHQGLSYALQALGDNTLAAKHREQGFHGHSIQIYPYRGVQTAIPILIFCSAMGGNIAFKHLLDEQLFAITLLFTEYFDTNISLPPHRLIINAIGDADLCHSGLDAAETLLLDCHSPIINAPAWVKKSGRLQNVVRFSSLPDVVTPKMVQLSKVELLSSAIAELIANYGITFPLLLRSPGFHTGQYFLSVECFDVFYAAVKALPGEDLLVIQMLNASNEQGEYHKYRVMIIDGVLYPLHLAISRHWKVHYFSANMHDQSVSRQKEKNFLEDMTSVLGDKAINALTCIGQMLGLDYAGIDFALTASGEVLLFEANATMVVPMPEADDKWQYRRDAVRKIQKAVKQMLINRCQC
ncbi:hypothetical protein [Methylomonas sp. AM2-LC]|uniref:hypothetical protein n=1 Tax=Methylomonas sp. AM2-LC TaxID=3153301 RepID=UPI0032638006